MRRLFFLMILFVAVASSFAAGKRFTLVIDAGHGGHDAGACGAFSKEKNINLNVALAFGKYVERNCPDVKVIYTRKTDIFIPLNERANIANRNKADLFISVHTNALPAGRIARGFETYTLGMHRAKDNLDVAKRENSVISMEKGYKQTYQGFDPNSSESYIMFEFIQGKNMEKSVELAKIIQRNVCSKANRPDKGVHQAGFLVLRATSMPSCLIELGFITTSDEENFLNSDSGIDQLGKGIYQAFVEYKRKYDGGVVVPYKAEPEDITPVESIVPDEYKIEKGKKEEDVKSEKKETKEKKAEVVVKEEQPQPAEIETKKQETQVMDAPVFKVQILASSSPVRAGDARLKGLSGVDCYQENRLYKYTYGASTDYNVIARQRKEILDKFPEAFVIAFKNGQRMDVVQAIQEFKQRNKK